MIGKNELSPLNTERPDSHSPLSLGQASRGDNRQSGIEQEQPVSRFRGGQSNTLSVFLSTITSFPLPRGTESKDLSKK